MATRANQIEILAAGVLFDGATIATPYAKFYAAGTTTAKDAYADVDKAVAITKKALDTQGRAIVYGDGIYKIRIYSGDPDAGGVLKFEIDNYKVTAVAGNTRTITATTVTGSADDSLVKADTTSNDITYTLPDAALMIGIFLHTVKVAAGNTFTVAAASGQTVNGAASLAFTVQYSASVFQSDGTNWFSYVATNADTLDTYHASTTAVAGTIPVYNSTPAIVGDITGNAATATTSAACSGNAATATNVAYSGLTGSVPTWNQNTTGNAATATTATKHGVLNVAVIEIGDWNMDSTANVSIAHGLTLSKIRSYSAMVRNDDDSQHYQAGTLGSGSDLYISSITATNVDLLREPSPANFDGTAFDSTTYNRGWIIIHYID